MSRQKTINMNVSDPVIGEMFNQLISGEGDEEIVTAKLVDIKKHLVVIMRTLSLFSTYLKKSEQFEEHSESLDDVVKELKEMVVENKDKSREEPNEKPHEKPHETAVREKPNDEFKRLKDNMRINQFIVSCSGLAEYHAQLNANPPETKWIDEQPGISFLPWKFSNLDIKAIWLSDINAVFKSIAVQSIVNVFKHSYKIYKLTTSPNINIRLFAETLVARITDLEKFPELSRCKEAIAKIRDAVGMLEDNFEEYYKDSVQSHNPNLIFENFIYDVSKDQTSNIRIIKQFRDIVKFIQKHTKSKPKDPRIAKMFDTLSEQLNSAEKIVIPDLSDTKHRS